MRRAIQACATSLRTLLVLVAVVVAIGGITLTARPALAQMAGALGKPLPSPDLPVGTVSVRIVAGSTSSPVVGTDVTVVVNNAPRVARTDAAGRAMFAGLPAGAPAIAKVVDADKVEHASEPFTIPSSGGTRLLISTKPWQAGGGEPAASGPGMPNPRQMSGEPRPQQGDPPGTITVRVTYDDFNDTPEGVPVTLVAYAADNSTTHKVMNTDRAGRAQFTDLDRSGGTSYFVTALLPRNGAVDRLVSSVIVLESQMGIRLLLSSEKRDSKAPPVDDLGKLDTQIATPAGKVRVVLEGVADASASVSVVDAATRKVLGEASAQSDAKPTGTHEAEPRPYALVDVPATAGQVVYAECLFRNQRYRSMPFQLLESTGTKIAVYVYPRILFTFQLQAEVEDELFAVRGRFEIRNYSWAPYRAGPDGMLVPLPRDFMGAIVAESDQSEVSVAAGEGFRIVRPIPPGGRPFRAGFSLPVSDGHVAWALDLPLGAFSSQLAIRQTSGMVVNTPPGVDSQPRDIPEGKFYLLGPIQIQPNKSMVMSLEGLPSPPAWRTVLPGIVGVLVVGMLLAGLCFALFRRPQSATPAVASNAAQRQRMLEELVELERSGANPRRRDQLLRELEELWG